MRPMLITSCETACTRCFPSARRQTASHYRSQRRRKHSRETQSAACTGMPCNAIGRRPSRMWESTFRRRWSATRNGRPRHRQLYGLSYEPKLEIGRRNSALERHAEIVAALLASVERTTRFRHIFRISNHLLAGLSFSCSDIHRRALQIAASATPSTRAIRPARLPPARAPLATPRVSIGNWNTSLPSSELAELFSSVRLRHCRGMRFSYDANRRQRQRFRICWNAGKCNHPCVFHRVSQNPDSTFSILTLARPPIARERQPSHRRVLCKVRLDLSSHDRTPIIPSTCRCKAHLSLPSHNDASHPIGTPFARRIATPHRAVER